MDNYISLDSEMKSTLGECKVGESKTFTVTMTVDEKTDEGISGTVTSVGKYESDKPKKPKNSKRAPAVSKALEEEEGMGY